MLYLFSVGPARAAVKLAVLLASQISALLLIHSAEAAFFSLWQLGENDGQVLYDFGVESRSSNPAPGSATARDDHYYLRGRYPSPIGLLLLDEPLSNFERSLTFQDPVNVVHFVLDGPLANAHNRFQFQFGTQLAGPNSSGVQTWLIEFNEHEMVTQSVSTSRDYSTGPFSADSLAVSPGENVISLRRLSGTSDWQNIDVLKLEIELASDFDSSGTVSGADFLTWQRNYGATSGAAIGTGDADKDGAVDGNDVAIWESQFGAAVGISAAAVSRPIPEPHSMILAVSFAGLIGLYRRSRGMHK